jgi:16S rRNA (cytidine1402-2'-O)-methyltransferase
MANLYIISTPIGNLADISYRAVEVLKNVDMIACEDTRVTKRLLDHYHIYKPVVSYHQHSKVRRLDYIVDLLKSGKDVALVSDAGTPGISDPGGLLVEEVAKLQSGRVAKLPSGQVSETRKLGNLETDVNIVPIPGSSSVVAALSISGMPADKFTFYGYLPKKKGRRTMLLEIKDSEITSVIFESVHRIKKTLQDMDKTLGKRPIVVCRELTKMFETVYRGNAGDIRDQVKEKGEFVLVIVGRKG